MERPRAGLGGRARPRAGAEGTARMLPVLILLLGGQDDYIPRVRVISALALAAVVAVVVAAVVREEYCRSPIPFKRLQNLFCS